MEKKKITYKDAIEEIEEIVSLMENEELDVDDLTVKVKRAAQLLKFCKEKLYETENEVAKIMKDMEKEQKA
jgi:exodeoxyribonuclease VII small subunit